MTRYPLAAKSRLVGRSTRRARVSYFIAIEHVIKSRRLSLSAIWSQFQLPPPLRLRSFSSFRQDGHENRQRLLSHEIFRLSP